MKLFYEKYIKLAHIGKGANAHVYKVRHAELGYVRAIKVLNDYIENKGERSFQSFLKECKTLLAIGNGAHPNIVRIYGPDLIDNHAIVEMDYVQGITLDSYIRDKGFIDYNEIIRFIQDIVGALAYTHHDIYTFLMEPEEDDLEIDPDDGSKYLISSDKEKVLVKKYGISHNDLHSNNIMRREFDGHFVLLDFGLAVQDGRCVKSSRIGDGNPEYQSPEKFDHDTVDPRSDVYSIGILLYELLAGRVPFKLEYDKDGKVSRRAINDVLNKHLRVIPHPILPLRKATFEMSKPGAVYHRDYPEWLDNVVMKCLAKNPIERYENAKTLLYDINHHLNDETPEKEIERLNKKISDLSNLYDSEHIEKEKLSAEAGTLKAEQIRLAKEYDAILADNKELSNRLEAVISVQSDANENIQGEMRRLKSENAILLSQWIQEKEENKRLIIDDEGLNKEIHELRRNVDRLTTQCAYEKDEKEKLQTRIQKIEKSCSSTGKSHHKRWKILALSLSIAIICVGIWGYCMALDYDTANWRYKSLMDELAQKGLLTESVSAIDELSTVDTTVVLPEQSSAIDSAVPYQVVYQTPPAVQKELNQLKSENSRLRGQVERLLSSMSN